MDGSVRARFPLGKQSSLKPEREDSAVVTDELDDSIVIDPGIKLMYLANDGDSDGIRELLDSGTDVNFHDTDGRTSLHVASCQGRLDVVELLLERGADVDVQDRWGSTVSFRILCFWYITLGWLLRLLFLFFIAYSTSLASKYKNKRRMLISI